MEYEEMIDGLRELYGYLDDICSYANVKIMEMPCEIDVARATIMVFIEKRIEELKLVNKLKDNGVKDIIFHNIDIKKIKED